MKISVKSVTEGAYTLSFDETEVVLDEENIKDLLLQITKIMLPIYGGADNAERKTKELTRLMKSADNIGIQKVIGISREDDILVFLKTVEEDEELLKKFYSNMSERLRKMIVEDLNYKFKEDEPEDIDASAFVRLIRIAKDLQERGLLDSAKAADSLANTTVSE